MSFTGEISRKGIDMLTPEPMPFDLDAEQCTLGSCMISENASFDSASLLTENDFYLAAHQQIFGAIYDLLNRAQPLDIVTVSGSLTHRGQLESSGGAFYLSTLIDAVPSAVNARQYADRVKECSILRRVKRVGSDMYHKATDSADGRELLNEYQAELLNMSFERDSSQPELVAKTAHTMFSEMDRYDDAESRVGFGIPKLDEMIAGLQEGHLVIVAARTSIGKTWLALQAMLHNARQGIPCGMFSLEMSKIEITRRLVGLLSGVNAHRIRQGNITDEQALIVAEAAGKFAGIPIVVDDPPSLNVFDLHVKARRMKAQHRIGMLTVDHLGLMAVPKNDNRAQAIGDVTRIVKGLARELKVPVLLLHQLNR